MRIAIAMLLASLTVGSAEASWGWEAPMQNGTPRYYQPQYYAPYYYAPCWCECPPVMTAPPMAKPTNPPLPMPEKPPAKTGGATPEGVPYSPIAPVSGATEEKVPKAEVPAIPKVEAAPPPKVEFKPTEFPKVDVPAAPKLELPTINPPAPKLDLPPLNLQVGPEKTTSKYRGSLDVKLTAVAGERPRDGKYKINFNNYTDRNVEVMVDGARIVLPAKHVTTASVGVNYRWSVDGGEVAFGAIADGSRGADVSIK